MATIIDSLFLELGIDTTKFSADQTKALAKIQQFEAQTKRAAGNSRDAIKTVGQAFKDLSRDSSIGSSAARLDTLASKITSLGKAASVTGGAGAPLGLMARGIGALLSPASLGVAAVGLLGAGMWDLNKQMTAANATLYRQAQLTSMGAKSMWAWGEAAKTVGANPTEITGGISGLQTGILGMGIGAGNATAQLVALSRLGVGFNFQSGANIDQLFGRVHQLAAARGYQNLGALRALTGPVMNDAMFNLATDRFFNPNTFHKQLEAMAPANLQKTLQNSLQSQAVLGNLGISKDVLTEVAYGGEQGLLLGITVLLRDILNSINKMADFFVGGAKTAVNAAAAAVGLPAPFGVSKGGAMPKSWLGKAGLVMETLMGAGVSPGAAEAMVGNFTAESSLNPLARNATGHAGLMQWDKSRQAAFAKWSGYQIGSSAVSARQQLIDQSLFSVYEMSQTQRQSLDRARGLIGKTLDFMKLDEIVNDSSGGRRLFYATEAAQLGGLGSLLLAASGGSGLSQNSVTNHTRIGDIHISTPATDGKGVAMDFRKALNTHPLLGPLGQQQATLATRGAAG